MSQRLIHRATAFLIAAAVTTAGWAGVTVAGAALGFGPAALAQQAPSDGQGAPGGQAGHGRGRRFGKILMSLGLSDGQKSQIREIMKAARAQNQNLTDPQQKRANMRAALAKVETVLTPAQRDQLHKQMPSMSRQPQQQ